MGELTSASGRANTVVQIQAGMQVQPVVFVTSAGAFVNVGTATTIPAGVTNTAGQPNTVALPQAGMQIRAVCVLDSTGAYVYS